MKRTVARGLFAAVLAGTLGFGATQVLAAPAPADAERVCNPIACNRQCEAMFGPFASGFCTEGGMCACAV
jgi:hypothetical protein